MTMFSPFHEAAAAATLKTTTNTTYTPNLLGGGGGGSVAQSVECATPGEEVSGSIPTGAARSLLVGSVSV